MFVYSARLNTKSLIKSHDSFYTVAHTTYFVYPEKKKEGFRT